MPASRPPVVTVFGSSRPAPDTPAYDTAYQLGHALAEQGWIVCNGGYGGTMTASAHGAVDAGGHTIGVTCEIFGRGGPNPHIRQEVPTFDLHHRLNTLVRLGRGYVALPGGTGTLLEIALVWELFNKQLLKRRAPIILLGEHWVPILQPIAAEHPDGLQLSVVPDVAGAIAVLQEALSGHQDCAKPGDEKPPHPA